MPVCDSVCKIILVRDPITSGRRWVSSDYFHDSNVTIQVVSTGPKFVLVRDEHVVHLRIRLLEAPHDNRFQFRAWISRYYLCDCRCYNSGL
jgi:hypothetical protein